MVPDIPRSQPSRPSASALDNERLRSLLDVTRTLAGTLDLDEVLDRVLNLARELTGARYAALGILDSSRSSLERFLTVGIDEATRRNLGELPRGRGILGVLIDDPRPLRLSSIGEHARSYGFPAGHPRMTTFLGAPVIVRGEPWGNLYLTDKHGEQEFSEADEEAVVILSNLAGVAIDNARLYEQASGRREELERAVAVFQATTELSQALGGETELPRILELLVKRGRAVLEARSMIILLIEGEELLTAAAAGEIDRDGLRDRIPIDHAAIGDVVRSGRPLRIDEDVVARRALFDLGIEGRYAAVAPLRFHGRSRGVLIATDPLSGSPFSADDERLLAAFATGAATAVTTGQSVQEVRLQKSIEASEEERRRWARELHDETLQQLAAVRTLLASSRGESAPPGVELAIEQTNIAITSLRALITELRPAALDELGLGPAIEDLIGRTRALHDLEITADVHLGSFGGPSGERLDTQVESSLYRCVQEALTNVVKHAHATTVELSMRESEDYIELCVSDDGIGFDRGTPAEGFGLLGMGERMALVRGVLDIESEPSQGTTLTARVPARRGQSALEPRRRAG